jgi:hypothetical protein
MRRGTAILIRQHPKIQLKLRLGNIEIIRRWVLDREVEVGIFVDDAVYHSSQENSPS